MARRIIVAIVLMFLPVALHWLFLNQNETKKKEISVYGSSNVPALPAKNLKPRQERYGIASWYGKNFHGKKMANGKRFNMHDPSLAACKVFPRNSSLLVTNVENGKSVFVKVTDSGKFDRYGRIIDLSSEAANKLGFRKKGLTRVKITCYSK